MTISQLYFIADEFQTLDCFGPLDAFMDVNSFVSDAYSTALLSINAGPVKNAFGQTIHADYGLEDAPQCHDLILCGGVGMRLLDFTEPQLMQLRKLARGAKRVFSICTGAFILAKLFPNDPMTLTTHWRHCASLARQHPAMHVQSEPLYVKWENRWSSAGVLSGVDLALAIIRQDHGNTVAANVAKELVIYAQRAGSQNQFSDMLKIQSAESLSLSPLLEWLQQNIKRTIPVVEMAEFACLSERQLTRLFKQHLGTTPSSYFRQLKLIYARDLLSEENISIEQVAYSVGFSSYDSFRRAFYKQFSVSPSTLVKGTQQ